MKFLRTAVLTASVIDLLSGCVSIGDKPGEIAALPSRTDGVQNIVVTRDSGFIGSGNRWYLTVNDIDVARLRNGDSIRFGLEPGNHDVGVRCPNSQLPGLLDWTHRVREIVVSDDSAELSITVAPRCNLDVADAL